MSTNTTTLNYKSKIAIPFGKLQSVLDWCNTNCQGEWRYSDDTGLNSPAWLHNKLDSKYVHIFNHFTIDYVFSFESEHDHLAFILVHE